MPRLTRLLALALVLPAYTGLARAEDLKIDISQMDSHQHPLAGSIVPTGFLHVIVPKEGILGAFGHDHVVESRELHGRLSLWSSSAALTLGINAHALEIDSPPARAAAGIRKDVGDKDRAKIKESMRGPRGLDVAHNGLISFHSRKIEPVAEDKMDLWLVSGDLSLRGVTQALEFAARLEPSPQGYWISGSILIRPSDYGIKPFKVAAGLIRVKDEARVSFRLPARR